jgi:hypothetical protein
LDTDPRSREARARAELALVDLALAFGEHAGDLVVIGGLNPDFLAPAAPVPHLGTTDVDILLELGFVYDRDDLDFSWLSAALERAGFEPKTVDAWQWFRHSDDASVRVDFLCDVADSPDQTIALPGTTAVSAKNLAGPSGALASPITRELTVGAESRHVHPDAPETLSLRFASLGGYLLAKAAALVTRRQEKDAYDFMYVALYNPAGPTGAALAIAAALGETEFAHTHHLNTDAALNGYDADEFSAWFARQMQASGDDTALVDLADEARRGAAAIARGLA